MEGYAYRYIAVSCSSMIAVVANCSTIPTGNPLENLTVTEIDG